MLAVCKCHCWLSFFFMEIEMSYIPKGKLCDHCEELAEFETDEYYLCADCHEHHAAAYIPKD